MTKKCFACIKSAQETMDNILNLTESAMNQPMTALKTLVRINEIAKKWNADFGDVDPAWTSENNNNAIL